ncbi:hypothetical protein EMIT0111MI5_100159 [Burkholderia sp. IT-111MI5]
MTEGWSSISATTGIGYAALAATRRRHVPVIAMAKTQPTGSRTRGNSCGDEGDAYRRAAPDAAGRDDTDGQLDGRSDSRSVRGRCARAGRRG